MTWREIFIGGTPEAEEAYFAGLAARMVAIQQRNGGHSRTLHAKTVVGVTNAELAFAADLPGDLHAGPFAAGTRLPALVRLSNASGLHRSDTEPDLRGAAVRVQLPDGGAHDLLMTNYPVSHARDAGQFVTAAEIGSGPRVLAIPRMMRAFGPSEALRILSNVRQASRRSDSLATESYWSRGAILWGPAGPVRFRLSPAEPAPARTGVPQSDPDRLRLDFAARLADGPVRFDLALQRYVSEESTPIEDGAVRWDSPWSPVATLTIPAQELRDDHRAEIDATAFSPWNAPAEFRPLGSLNRARRAVYAASARHWQR